MSSHAVVIAGSGPTGLMLAGELALAGVDVAIVERRAGQELAGSRGGGLHSRTMEVFDQRGIAGRFLSQGQTHTDVHFHIPLTISDFPTRHNYVLALWQSHIERILADWIAELGVNIYREREVTGFTQDPTGVSVEMGDGRRLRAEYLAGCDGGRSVVRKTAGIEFTGWDATTSWLIAEAHVSQEPVWGLRNDAIGTHGIGKLDDAKRVRIVLTEATLGPRTDPSLDDVKAAMVAVYGTDFGIHEPTWLSRFTDMTRQAATYRDRRVLLAGDAAHVHPPMGGQGLNIGVQDAVNLGWKLAQVVKGTSPERLLDTYQTERHPVGARVLRNAMAQTAIRRPDERTTALGECLAMILKMDEPRKRLAAEMSGLGVHYDLGNGHPLLGRRMPDLDLMTAVGPLRVFTLLHEGRPAIINFGEPADWDVTGWADRVPLIHGKYEGVWELPGLGEVPPPGAVLVRPDGYVSWVGEGNRVGLPEALNTWFGPADPFSSPGHWTGESSASRAQRLCRSAA